MTILRDLRIVHSPIHYNRFLHNFNDKIIERERGALKVTLQLLHTDIIMQPSAAEIRRAVAGLLCSLREAAQPFVRWMAGTCLEAAPVAGTHPRSE